MTNGLQARRSTDGQRNKQLPDKQADGQNGGQTEGQSHREADKHKEQGKQNEYRETEEHKIRSTDKSSTDKQGYR